MMRDSSCRALSLCPSATSFRAAFIIAPACRSFGTVSTSHATTAPRSEETMAVRMRKLRVRTDGDVQEQRQHWEHCHDDAAILSFANGTSSRPGMPRRTVSQKYVA